MANNNLDFGDFGAAVKDAFNRYADFSGRSTRPQYWYYILAMAISSAIVSIIAGDSGLNVLSLVTLLPTLAVAIRRMHDVGKSGWFLWVPIYNIVLLASPSKSDA